MLATRIRQRDGIFYTIAYPAEDLLKKVRFSARFDAEVGKIYPKTDEAARAPLRRVDINGPRPADLAEIDFGAFTPTFVLVDGGHERGRIRGYPGEESFYGMLDSMLRDLDSAKTASSAP